MDWKVRKTLPPPWRTRDRNPAFPSRLPRTHRYTMKPDQHRSAQTDLFAKFNWPRVSNPVDRFSLPENEREAPY